MELKPYQEVINEKSKGVYVGMKLSSTSRELLHSFTLANNIPNPLDKDDYHTTVIYSRNYDDIKVDAERVIKTTIKGFHVFETDEGNALVAVLDCAELGELHHELMGQYDLTYDYDEYVAHLTLSYNSESFDISKLSLPEFQIELHTLYVEDLDLDWVKKD